MAQVENIGGMSKYHLDEEETLDSAAENGIIKARHFKPSFDEDELL